MCRSRRTVNAGIAPRGKPTGATPNGVRGINEYTGWFAADTEMGGTYGGYDGPCPPWNDVIIHHYHFKVFSLDIDRLGLDGDFPGTDAISAMQGHVLAGGEVVGTYTQNPALT